MDEELKKVHQTLRRDWAKRAPAFLELMAKARASNSGDRGFGGTVRKQPRRSPHRKWLGWGVAAALATSTLVAVVLVAQWPSEADRFETLVSGFQEETNLGYWEGPTQFLLDIPGREITRYVPTITWPETWLETWPDPEALTRNGSEP